jgi:hypothetical protein
MGYPTGKNTRAGTGMGKILYPRVYMGNPTGRIFFDGYGYGMVLPDGYVPVAIPNRASSTAEPIPRFEATQRTTQRLQPGATVNTAEDGPAVMAVAGGQMQRSRRQPSLRPIRGQRENPLSRREDNAPVTRSSNGSRTRNGYPANYSPRRINSAAGHAAPLAGEASDASPSS